MYDSFWDWKINNQFEVDPVIRIADLRFDVRRKSRVADARLRPATAPRLGSDLSQRVLQPACVARKVGPNLCRWKGEPGSRGSKGITNAVTCVINIIISAHFKPVKRTLGPRTYVHGSRAGIYNDPEAGLKLVEKVNGRARPSETRVNHPQKRQCLRCSPYIGVTTAPLLAWPSASAWKQLREPVAYMPDVSGCEATGGRKVRWKELIRSAAHKAPSPQWNVWTGHEFWRTSHNLTWSENNHQTANGYAAMAANKKTWACMRVVMWGCSPERRFVCLWARCAAEALPAFLKRGTETGDEFLKKRVCSI